LSKKLNRGWGGLDLDPLPQPEVQIPSGPGESSKIHNPHVGSQSIHVEDEEDEDPNEDYD